MKFLQVLPFLFSIALLLGCAKEDEKNFLKHVDLLIGTGPAETPAAQSKPGDHVDYGQTIPAVTAPFGMTQWTPQTFATEKKCLSPFYWGTPTLQGYRATHWTSGSCVQDYGSFTVFPAIWKDSPAFMPAQRNTLYIYDADHSSPAYFSAAFPNENINTELTATKRAGFFRFSWNNGENAVVIVDVNSDEGEGFIKIDPENNEISGYNPVHRIYNGNGKPAGFSGYFAARFDRSFENTGTYAGNSLFHDVNQQQSTRDIGAYVRFNIPAGEVLKMKMGTSFTSIENARQNMEEEIPHWDFEQTRKELEDTWNTMLGKINVEGGSADDLTKFYTAMYHSLIHPRLFSDVNGDYPEFAGGKTIQKAQGFDYYCDFSNWDIFRAQMPLLSLIAPAQYEDMVKSLIVKAEQGGWLPIFPMWNSYTSAMIGDHSTAVIADALMKGFVFDAEKAYQYMYKNASQVPEDENEYIDGKGRRALESYLQYGFVPLEDKVQHAFHRQEQVSRTLEYAYNDWAVAQVAKKLGKTADYNELMARSLNYANVFDPEKGWVCGRFSDSTFTSEFEAGEEMFYITEGTPKHYTWFVPHDVEGLAELMGGNEQFTSKLHSIIDNKEYWHGNEPSHHIPYLFNYAGEWQKTQETVKHLLLSEYATGPGGLSGNDDAGQMSAWYVFSAMGFYPVCPGSNEYQLSSPAFEKVTLNLDKKYYPGENFVLEASPGNPYGIFNLVKLNDTEIEPVINHKDIQNGGRMEFLME